MSVSLLRSMEGKTAGREYVGVTSPVGLAGSVALRELEKTRRADEYAPEVFRPR